MRWKKLLYSASLLLILLCIWEIAAHKISYMRFLAPAPSAVAARLIEQPWPFLMHASVTLEEMLGGMLLAFLAAFPLAWAMARYTAMSLALQPIFVVVKCVPMFILAPIMVIWLGWTYWAIVLPTALMIFFPFTLTLFQGLKATPPAWLDLFRLNHASQWQLFWLLRLPASLPYLFAGLRIAAAIAGVGAVAGEWAGAQKGLGIFMLESRRYVDLEAVFGGLFALVVISLSLYGCIAFLERVFLRGWRYEPLAH